MRMYALIERPGGVTRKEVVWVPVPTRDGLGEVYAAVDPDTGIPAEQLPGYVALICDTKEGD